MALSGDDSATLSAENISAPRRGREKDEVVVGRVGSKKEETVR
jgi:hypothetical protein